MKQIELVGIIEGILFTMGDSVEVSRMASALEVTEQQVYDAAKCLEERYEQMDSGMKLIYLEGALQLCTKGELFDSLVKIASQPKKQVLTETMLETLSIVAYKQPVTRMDIEKIRGVSSDHAINRLIEFGLIEEVGRLDAPGRPILFATTEQFLRSFGISSIAQLPQIDAGQIEQMKQEVQKEVGGISDEDGGTDSQEA